MDESGSSSNEEKIKEFSETFIVKSDLVINYVKHLEHLEIKRKKRADKRREESSRANVPSTNVEESSSVTVMISTSDSSSEEESDVEIITGIIGSSSSSESSSESDSIQQPIRRSIRAKRTTFRTRHFYGDSD